MYGVIHKPRGQLRGKGRSEIPKILTTWFMDDLYIILIIKLYQIWNLMITHCGKFSGKFDFLDFGFSFDIKIRLKLKSLRPTALKFYTFEFQYGILLKPNYRSAKVWFL